MKHYKIGKYDYSNKDYLKTWSSIWDVLDRTNIETPIPKYYFDMEKKYLNVAANFIVSLGFERLVLGEIEDNRYPDTEVELRPLYQGLLGVLSDRVSQFAGRALSFMDTIYILQLSLREVVWAKFVHSSGAYIAFGHDYYWLIGVDDNYDVTNIVDDEGLFFYQHPNPWE